MSALLLIFEAYFLANTRLWWWALLFLTYWFISLPAAIVAVVMTSLQSCNSYKKDPLKLLPRYAGPLDVFLGRPRRASSHTKGLHSNNNVTIATFENKAVMAYRKAPSHFASPEAKVIVAIAAVDDLDKWTEIWEYSTGTDDIREMILFRLNSTMFLYFSLLAPSKCGFTPRNLQWCKSNDCHSWSKPQQIGRPTEIAWDIKVHKDIVYKTSYTGNHYCAKAVCTVLFEKSTDGMVWEPVGKQSEVYSGGVCEVSFAFLQNGDLVAIGRNEDGDATGWGSQIFYARADYLGNWQHLAVSLPSRLDSPRLMCTSKNELLLFARFANDSYAYAPSWMPRALQKGINLTMYSSLPKSAAVYRIDHPNSEGVFSDTPVEIVQFLEAYGDTGFFSLAEMPGRTDEWILANYASTCHSHAPWLYGQVYPTDVFVCRCSAV